VFKFTGRQGDPFVEKEKETKRVTLLELVDFVTTQRASLTEPVMMEIFEMLSANLFRPLPPW
jgi:serine/threonine-protein phosphatase 2A regulatory subunit B'